jgi:hypothetical protein
MLPCPSGRKKNNGKKVLQKIDIVLAVVILLMLPCPSGRKKIMEKKYYKK